MDNLLNVLTELIKIFTFHKNTNYNQNTSKNSFN